MYEPVVVQQVEACVDSIIDQVGSRIVLAVPLGLGKPNQLVNALYRRASQDSSLQLKIITALSLEIPTAKNELQRRFLEPFLERLYQGYEGLDYVTDMKQGTVPDNIEICAFFLRPGEYLGNDYPQQHYISSNYTHVARDLLSHGVNVIAQLVAVRWDAGHPRYSLSCNPDVTLDLWSMLASDPHFTGRKLLSVGQVHRDLPFMPNQAEVDSSNFDIVVDNPDYDTRLFSTPNMPVSLQDHLIGYYASALIRDGGTLQIGIGAMADAIVHACLLRQRDNRQYQTLLAMLDVHERYSDLLNECGGTGLFEQGLYGCSEMFVNGFRFLIDAGIVKRGVFDDINAQALANEGGPVPEPGIMLHGGFFLGPADFYQWLRDLPEAVRNRISMNSVGFVNQLRDNPQLLRQQRKAARFINTGMMATLTGAVVSDGLESGQVVSGVGGQYNFVAMAHELADARSILLIRAVRESGQGPVSNVVFNYGHCTIPRHLRDIVITEYGIADLRGKTDQAVIKAMLNVADSRFQPELLERAKAAKKLPADYEIPQRYRNNLPESLTTRMQVFKADEVLPEFPLGTDFTAEEQVLIRVLTKLKQQSRNKWALLDGATLKQLLKALFGRFDDEVKPYLERMTLAKPSGLRERMWAGLLAAGVKQQLK